MKKRNTQNFANKIFEYHQNNSGGRFSIDKNIDKYVLIFARSIDEANEKFYNIGGYFNGVEEGRDCRCCGDRWCQPDIWNDTLAGFRYHLNSFIEFNSCFTNVSTKLHINNSVICFKDRFSLEHYQNKNLLGLVYSVL